MRLVVLCLLLGACARPSLPRELDAGSCLSVVEEDAGQRLALAPQLSAVRGCGAGTYVGRFVCGSGTKTLAGELVLTLAPGTGALHTSTPSALLGTASELGGKFSATLEGKVDCGDLGVDVLVRGAYEHACAALPLDGYLDGRYDAAKAQLSGRMELEPDLEEVALPVALRCRWCASSFGACELGP